LFFGIPIDSYEFLWNPVKDCETESESWGAYDAKGQPIGNGCLICMETVVEGWPGMDFDTGVQKYNDKVEKFFKPMYKTARAVKKDLGARALKSKFPVPSTVQNGHERSRTIYHECGFLTEAEVAAMAEVSGKHMKLQKGNLMLEDMTGTVSGYYISLKGLPLELMMSIRKVRNSYKVYAVHEEERLNPGNQIRKDQGSVMFDFVWDKQLEVFDNYSKSYNRSKIYTYSDILSKAHAVLKEHRATN
jgi:hypothetical protein